MKKKLLYILFFMFFLEMGNAQKPMVINSDSTACYPLDLVKMKEQYENMIDPRILSEAEIEQLVDKWIKFHKKLKKYLDEVEIQWNVPDTLIKLSIRVYFDKNGNVDYYFYTFLNKNIPWEAQRKFKEILYKFSKETNIGIRREKNFAQCGSLYIENKENNKEEDKQKKE